MKKGISTHCPYSERNEEREKEFEASLVDDGNQNHAQQGEQADDSDGNEAADPRCRETVGLVQERSCSKQTGERVKETHQLTWATYKTLGITGLQSKTKTWWTAT